MKYIVILLFGMGVGAALSHTKHRRAIDLWDSRRYHGIKIRSNEVVGYMVYRRGEIEEITLTNALMFKFGDEVPLSRDCVIYDTGVVQNCTVEGVKK